MKYKKPTYEEYCNASTFAKARYRYGIYIQLTAAILLLFLIYYAVTNVEAMTTNPIDYAEEKMGVQCFSPMEPLTVQITPQHNGSIRNIRGT